MRETSSCCRCHGGVRNHGKRFSVTNMSMERTEVSRVWRHDRDLTGALFSQQNFTKTNELKGKREGKRKATREPKQSHTSHICNAKDVDSSQSIPKNPNARLECWFPTSYHNLNNMSVNPKAGNYTSVLQKEVKRNVYPIHTHTHTHTDTHKVFITAVSHLWNVATEQLNPTAHTETRTGTMSNLFETMER